MRTLAILIVGLLAISPALDAGDKKKKDEGPSKVERGPEHKILESLVGVFDAKVKVYIPDPTKPSETTGVMTRTMILGGNFLQESYMGDFFKTPFTGLGVMGYDGNKKKFVTTWADSMSTSIMLLEGTYDAPKKTFTMVGDDYEPNAKKKMKARDVLRITGDDTQSFEMYRLPEGAPAEMKVMEITYSRRK